MNSTSISLEFFPPRSEAQLRRFWCTLGCLQTLKPSYISMTWGALGAASQASLDILEPLLKDSEVPVTAHLSCSGETRSSMLDKIETLENMGVTRFLALRGDQTMPASNEAAQAGDRSGLQHASDLVALLAERGHKNISVAAYPDAHPESADFASDIHWLKHKLDKGAKQAVTQFFFEAESFLRFRDKCEAAGISQKLIPGILPIHDIEKVSQFSEKCGAVVPSKLLTQFQKAVSPEDKHEAAVTHCLSLCQKLQAEGVDEFHLYTLNQSALAYEIGSELLGSGAGRAGKAGESAAA
ncbi:methylenetetrahydrofolate reductase [Granulosicoccus sp.]|nr:methylenetetrahydrofolate reductase [Granulosicoccus sp.]MDB4222404.1 methylenetetrahydrofolate reductase [Granulosicoccus sp.]